MKLPHQPADARALAPLLASIGRELTERNARLAELQARLAELGTGGSEDERRALRAESATHRRELRHLRAELERLGCSVVGTTPLTIRILTRDGGTSRSFVWQAAPGSRR